MMVYDMHSSECKEILHIIAWHQPDSNSKSIEICNNRTNCRDFYKNLLFMAHLLRQSEPIHFKVAKATLAERCRGLGTGSQGNLPAGISTIMGLTHEATVNV